VKPRKLCFNIVTTTNFLKGKYIIGIKQGMRTNNLVGIEDIGVKIENSKQP
jgi:gliding motility-associated lipoprotein GldH